MSMGALALVPDSAWAMRDSLRQEAGMLKLNRLVHVGVDVREGSQIRTRIETRSGSKRL